MRFCTAERASISVLEKSPLRDASLDAVSGIGKVAHIDCG